MREFHANPLPDPQPDPLPEKCTKPSTIPEPFDLKIDERFSQHAEEWARKVSPDNVRHSVADYFHSYLSQLL